jgi:hypothetical protein
MDESNNQVNPNPGKLTVFDLLEDSAPVKFVQTTLVKAGVEFDTYTFDDDDSRDLTIARVAPGALSLMQRVLDGSMTLEGYVEGSGILYITPLGEDEQSFTFGPDEANEPIVVEVGDIMQWQADEGASLTYYEICYPPYEEGRFEILPDPEIATESNPEEESSPPA